MTNISRSPRYLAVRILSQVEQKKAFAEVLIDRYLSAKLLNDPRDRRLLTEIVYGTLRLQGYLDWILNHFLEQSVSSLSVASRNILRTAIYQRYFLEKIPPYAIVSEAVNIAKKMDNKYTKLTNAVLRACFQKFATCPKPKDSENLPQYIAIKYAHPQWLVEEWIAQWGVDQTRELCMANIKVPPIVVRVNSLKITREKAIEELRNEGIIAERTKYSPDGLLILEHNKQIRETALLENGYLQIQDEASQLVSYLASPQKGSRVLDLCAGKGGKSAHMAAIMNNTGEIIAVDINKKKSIIFESQMKKLGVKNTKMIVADARYEICTHYDQSFDRVLVDAPCTGTGTLRRAPEIKWRLSIEDVIRCRELQRQLIQQAARYVRRGGRLVYVTCSLLKEENETIVEGFLANQSNFSLTMPEGIHYDLLDRSGFFRTSPHIQGMDGFFGAVMIRK
ncbi:MAG: 16S rRNA (cytosine(967)-C(5))-methyltransferase RsmB [Syntrophales bacterium]|nr:16S rRNA (cytosine(967)-C(5))-methyltransferase RsmB [Syntrophales bacterium]